jgi:phosphoribosylformimino-5-aminoimidazole carboxamide ribotide isomerase
VYLADLDAILGGIPDVSLCRELSELGLELWVDPGLRDGSDVERLGDLQDRTLVVGLETIRGPEALQQILERVGPDRMVFSVDLFGGPLLLAEGAGWASTEPLSLCRELIDLSVRRVLLLDLGRVGTGRGTGTEALLRAVRQESRSEPGLEISVGGGIAGIDQLAAARAAGASAVLLGSTLHDGRITRSMLEHLLDGSCQGPD